jgi:RNA polymerase sigma-70 factor, ECF subfamily
MIAELRDLSSCGLGLRHSCFQLELGHVYIGSHNQHEKRMRTLWMRKVGPSSEAGLMDEDVFLIDRIKAGETESFLQLVAPYRKSLYWTVRAILYNRADEEEVVQESLLKAMSHLHQFNPGHNFRGWLLRIATNEALKCTRRNRLRANSAKEITSKADTEFFEQLVEQLADPRESPSEALERKEIAERLFMALDTLDDIYRQVFLLHYLQHLPIAEVASLLGINVDTTNTRLHRARLQLRERLLQQGTLPPSKRRIR